MESSKTFIAIVAEDLNLTTNPPEAEPSPINWTVLRISFALLTTVVTLTTIAANAFVLYSFAQMFYRGKAPKVSHWYIANLSFADFNIGLQIMPFFGPLQVTGRWYFGHTGCAIWSFTHYCLCSASILSICAISIERFLGVKYPVQHMLILNRRRIVWSLAVLWLLALLPGSIKVFVLHEVDTETPYSCTASYHFVESIVVTVLIFFVPAITMLIAYYQIYRIASKHLQVKLKRQNPIVGLEEFSSTKSSGVERSTQHSDCGSSKSSGVESDLSPTSSTKVLTPEAEAFKEIPEKISLPDGSLKRKPSLRKNVNAVDKTCSKQIRLAKKLALLVALVLLFYGPYFTVILIRSIQRDLIGDTVFNIVAWFRYFNSCINPFVYAYMLPAFRKSFRRFLDTHCWGFPSSRCCSGEGKV